VVNGVGFMVNDLRARVENLGAGIQDLGVMV